MSWFGGKRRVADIVWDRFGDPINYIEPFAGSLAVMLDRPHAPKTETANDLDCMIANFWRATKDDPEKVVHYCDHPINEADLHARHLWLVKRRAFRERMKTDPHYYDAKIAGWWVWGICQWIGGGWCQKPEWRGRYNFAKARGIWRKRQNIKRGGIGVHRTEYRRPQISKRNGQGVNAIKTSQKIPYLKNGGMGMKADRVKRQIPDVSGNEGATGRGIHTASMKESETLMHYFQMLSDRLRKVRVCCGDWERILGRSPTTEIGISAVFLDPPYSKEMRDKSIYNEDEHDVASDVAEWARANGDNQKLRIALCGYENEHEMPSTWTMIKWKTNGGYGNANALGRGKGNSNLERIWFSPHCLIPNEQKELIL